MQSTHFERAFERIKLGVVPWEDTPTWTSGRNGFASGITTLTATKHQDIIITQSTAIITTSTTHTTHATHNIHATNATHATHIHLTVTPLSCIKSNSTSILPGGFPSILNAYSVLSATSDIQQLPWQQPQLTTYMYTDLFLHLLAVVHNNWSINNYKQVVDGQVALWIVVGTVVRTVSWREPPHTPGGECPDWTTCYHGNTYGTAVAVAGNSSLHSWIKWKWICELMTLTTVWHVLGAAALSGSHD